MRWLSTCLCCGLLLSCQTTTETPLRFPEGFLWGVATAAQQIEGGIQNNDWAQWERLGRVPSSGKAADFYHRYKEDIAAAAALHLKAFRLSIE